MFFCRNSDEEAADGAEIENSMETSDAEEPRPIRPATTGNDHDEYNFNDYDNELNLQFANLGDVAVIDTAEQQLQDDEDSEAEDDLIKSDDNLLIVGHVDEDAASLEVFGSCFRFRLISQCVSFNNVPCSFQFTTRQKAVSTCIMTFCCRVIRFASNGCITILNRVMSVIW